MEYQRDKNGMRFDIRGGMNTVLSSDLLKVGEYAYLQNTRKLLEGRIAARPPLSNNLLGSTLPAGVTSLLRLNDTTNLSILPAGYVYIMGAGGDLYVTTTSIATGLSGGPLGLITFRPNASPQPWCYVADPSEVVSIPAYISSGYGLVAGAVKVRSDGTCWKTGIKEPQTAPIAVFAGGGGGTTQIQYRYVYRSSVTGAPSNPSPESVAGTNQQFGPSATINASQYATNIDFNSTQYEYASPQLRTKGGVAPGVVTDYIVFFNFGFAIPDGTQVANVTGSGGSGMTIGTYPLSFSGGTPTTAATGTITVLTATTYTIAITSGGLGYHSAPSVTAATGGTPPSLLAILTTAANIDGVMLDLNWVGQNAGTGVLSGVQLWYQGSPLGRAKFPGIANQSYVIDTLQGGSSDTWGTPLSATIVNDPSFGAAFQITTQSVGGSDRSFVDYATTTVYYSTQNADVTPSPSLDPQVDKIDFYRFGGALPSFTYIGTGPNSSTPFVDTLNDLAALGNPLLQFDNYEPFPSIGLPLGGTASVAAGTIAGTMQMTSTAGSALPLNLLPGTLVILGTTAYTTYNRPTSATAVTLVLPAGQSIPSPATGLVWEIQEPDLAATPSPAIWGPTPDSGGGSFYFGLDPINRGDLLWSNGNNFDSAGQGNRMTITSGSEFLLNGTITAELSTVFSTERFWLIYPNFANVSILLTGVQGSQWTPVQSASTRGLYMPYALDALGVMIAWRAKDCIAVSMGGAPEKSITDSIYNLFPHGGTLPSPITLGGITIYPPDDTKPLAQTIKIAPGYIFYNYQDSTGTQRTLVYDVEADGWSVDAYTPPVNCHLWAVGPVKDLLTGCSDGTVRQLITGGTETGAAIVGTRSENGGDSRALKRIGDVFFKALITNFNPVTVALWKSRFTVAMTGFSPASLIGAGTLAPYTVDFTAGFGSDVDDIAALLTFPLGSGNILDLWQPDWISLPETIQDRPTDWEDCGYDGNKFIQGLRLELDTFNAAKAIKVERSDDGAILTPNESPITVSGQTILPFTFTPPFLAHMVRIVSTDGVPYRMWRAKWIFQPYPESVVEWQTEMLSHGLKGWQTMPWINLAYQSTAAITLTLIMNTGQTSTLTFASSGGVPTKNIQWLPANKYEMVSYRASSASPFAIFEADTEVALVEWGGAFRVTKPFGGQSSPGAEV